MELHAGLPRQSCGSAASTRRALEGVKRWLPEAPLIADLGCGPGSSILPLAKELPDARFIAVDLYAPFITELVQRAESAGDAYRISAHVEDMIAPPADLQSLDLIWSEGAIYNIGVERGLRTWRKFLKPGGLIVFNEPIWLTPPNERPAALTAFWSAYPSMTDDNGIRTAIHEAGYQIIDAFDLPEADWWEEYYDPLEQNLSRLEEKYTGIATALSVLNETRTEIDMRRMHAAHYNYRFYCTAFA